jgi:hypothetical protein
MLRKESKIMASTKKLDAETRAAVAVPARRRRMGKKKEAGV